MISTKGRYALRVMVDLASQNKDLYIPLKEISKRQEISKKYLESIMSVLSKEGFVDTLSGKGGGYKLNKPATQYTVFSILKATEKSLAPVACLDCDVNTCERSQLCTTLPMWEKLSCMIENYLDSVTIADLASKNI